MNTNRLQQAVLKDNLNWQQRHHRLCTNATVGLPIEILKSYVEKTVLK